MWCCSVALKRLYDDDDDDDDDDDNGDDAFCLDVIDFTFIIIYLCLKLVLGRCLFSLLTRCRLLVPVLVLAPAVQNSGEKSCLITKHLRTSMSPLCPLSCLSFSSTPQLSKTFPMPSPLGCAVASNSNKRRGRCISLSACFIGHGSFT